MLSCAVVGRSSGEDGWGAGLAVTVTASFMVLLGENVLIPDPTDGAWPRWAAHIILGADSSVILNTAGYLILNPNLEGTSTNRGNPTDWSFDPEIK